MTTSRSGLEPQTAQRLTVLAVTSALLVAGVALANTAGGSDSTSAVQAIRTQRALEAAAPIVDPLPAATPDAEIEAPGLDAEPLAPPVQPRDTRRVQPPARRTPEPSPPAGGGTSSKPGPVVPPADGVSSDDDDDHETIKPPVRDEDHDDESDPDAPKTNEKQPDESEGKVQRQGE